MVNFQSEKDIYCIEKLKGGSKEAYLLLWNQYGPKIYAFAFSYLKNKSDAEELLQEVFMKLWEKREKLDSTQNIKSYLFKICVNLIYDFFRKRNLEQAYMEFSSTNIPKSDTSTWHNVVYDDMMKYYRQTVSEMPDQMQHIFRLSRDEGLSNDEISTKLNLSKRTVENQLYRAISLLKSKFGKGSIPGLLFFYLFCN